MAINPPAAKEQTLEELEQASDSQPETLYTVVLPGYGKMPFNHKHVVDNVTFLGCVARNVPESTIKKWLKTGILREHKRLPNDTKDRDIARLAGIVTESPTKTAAILDSTDVDQLYQALGPQRARELGQQLLDRAPRRKNG